MHLFVKNVQSFIKSNWLRVETPYDGTSSTNRNGQFKFLPVNKYIHLCWKRSEGIYAY